MGWAKENGDWQKTNFMMDFENWCLKNRWDSRTPHPKGPNRFQHEEWAAMIKSECEDTTFEEYCEWCEAGGGDERFQEKTIDEMMTDPYIVDGKIFPCF